MACGKSVILASTESSSKDAVVFDTEVSCELEPPAELRTRKEDLYKFLDGI